MRNRLWFFRIIPWNQARRSTLFFLFLFEALCWMHLPIFSDCHFTRPLPPPTSHPFFFVLAREPLFFSVESTPENSRRHLVAELLITASLSSSTHTLFCPFFSPPFSGLEFQHTYAPFVQHTYVYSIYVYMYIRNCNRRIPRARLLGTNSKRDRLHGVAWQDSVASGDGPGGSLGWGERSGVGRGGDEEVTGLHRRESASCTLEDYPTRQYEITFVRDSARYP